MFGLPLEVFTVLLSALTTFLASVHSMKLKAQQAQNEMMLSALRAQGDLWNEVRQDRSPPTAWARRVIVIAAVFSVLLWPSIAPLFGLSVTTGWTELTGGFWPFTDEKARMVWHEAKGSVVITPLHTHLMSSIVGMYFGGSVAQGARLR